jgi:hypothetical protein
MSTEFQDRWNVIDLTRPGWRVTNENVSDLVAEVTATAANINMNNARVILQLLDNSVYMVRGPGGGDTTPLQGSAGQIPCGWKPVGGRQGYCPGPVDNDGPCDQSPRQRVESLSCASCGLLGWPVL